MDDFRVGDEVGEFGCGHPVGATFEQAELSFQRAATFQNFLMMCSSGHVAELHNHVDLIGAFLSLKVF